MTARASCISRSLDRALPPRPLHRLALQLRLRAAAANSAGRKFLRPLADPLGQAVAAKRGMVSADLKNRADFKTEKSEDASASSLLPGFAPDPFLPLPLHERLRRNAAKALN